MPAGSGEEGALRHAAQLTRSAQQLFKLAGGDGGLGGIAAAQQPAVDVDVGHGALPGRRLELLVHLQRVARWGVGG